MTEPHLPAPTRRRFLKITAVGTAVAATGLVLAP
ncbi:twin-arginine translocation signal domain-containing protein [Streptomyces sp. NPDC048278]